ncbi:alpha/beta-hydrolase [Gymnopus androsaceus JB14]|uniref:Alpha/beta-hydrolase n=1 Tax=Gymnopus androsaceus JB14 TaxID=1447944 RepID=A0A6A4HRF3_9AGAR|nr:alpha/beta-hydrolase [Gymnopus androsaceus JB14]
MTEKWLTGPRDIQFYTRTYVPSSGSSPRAIIARAIIVFIHGFQEHVGRYSHFHPSLADRGIAVWTFDQAGFGRTALDKEKRSKKSSWGKTGWSDQLQDVDWAVKTARTTFPGVPVFLMGHSMGGGEVLSFVTQQSSQYTETIASLAGVIATSPLIKQTTPASKLARWLGGKVAAISPYTLIPASLDVNDLSHSPESNKAHANDPLIKTTGSLRCLSEMLNEGENLLSNGHNHWPKKLPVVLIHGDADKITSLAATQTFYERIEADDKNIIVYPDGYHELQNELPEVRQKLVDDIVSFVEARAPVRSERQSSIPTDAFGRQLSDSNDGAANTVPSLTTGSSAPASPSEMEIPPPPDAEEGPEGQKAAAKL